MTVARLKDNLQRRAASCCVASEVPEAVWEKLSYSSLTIIAFGYIIITKYSVTLSNNIMEENICKEHC